jgi:hypothetical protein
MNLTLDCEMKPGFEVGAQIVVPSSRSRPTLAEGNVSNTTGQLVQGVDVFNVVSKKTVEILVLVVTLGLEVNPAIPCKGTSSKKRIKR